MASAISAYMAECVEQPFPTRLLFPCLPYHLAILPALCRTLAFMTVLPFIFLTIMDLAGWAVFKLVLRPLGYASTIRFKDPEPSDRIDDAPPTHQASMTGTSRHLSDTDDNASSASVSAASSPTFPSTPLPSVPEHDHQTRSSSSSKLAAKKGGGRPGPARRRRSASTGSDVSTASMAYERAPSVGVEGPLLEQQFDQDESTSPRSTASLSLDDADNGSGTAGPGLDGEEDEEEEGYEYVSRQQDQESTDKHSSVRARKNLPRGGPSFGFTGMDK